MTLLVVTPLTRELDFLKTALEHLHHTSVYSPTAPIPVHTFPDLDLVLAFGGHGKTQLAVHTRYLLDTLPDIHGVICAGAAGALSGNLAIGDVVIATRTVEHDFHERFDPMPQPVFAGSPALLEQFTPCTSPEAFRVVLDAIASGDEDIVDSRRGEELAKSTGAVAVAWEGAGVARACQLTNIPHLEIRGITDTANHQAATDFETNLKLAMSNIAHVLHATLH